MKHLCFVKLALSTALLAFLAMGLVPVALASAHHHLHCHSWCWKRLYGKRHEHGFLYRHDNCSN